MLQQSSLILYIWSEFRKLVIDFTTCDAEVDPEPILPELKSALDTDTVKLSERIL